MASRMNVWASRDYRLAGQWFRRALELAEVLADPQLEASSLNRLGNWLTNTGQVKAGVQAHQQALRVFENQQDTHGMADTLDLLALTNLIAGDLVTAVSQYGQAIALFRTTGDLRRLSSSLTNRVACSNPITAETTFSPLRTREECVQDGAEALHLARQADLPWEEAFAETSLGVNGFAPFGAFGPALSHVQQGLRIATEVGHQQWRVSSLNALGATYVLLLEPNAAQAALETALPLARELGSAFWTAEITIHLTRAYLLQHALGRAEAALSAVLPREQRPRDLADRRVRLVWGELLLAQGHPKAAICVAEELLETVPGIATIPEGQAIPWVLRLQGEALIALERSEEAIPVLESAEHGARERQKHARLWYLQSLLGQAYHQARQKEQARREWSAARLAIADLAATIDEPVLREHFIHAALTTCWSEGSPNRRLREADQYGGLTEREREVAVRIAQGKSNREIAELLAIHYRTVEKHIENTLAKLGFSSRTQIAVWVCDKGLGKPDQRAQ